MAGGDPSSTPLDGGDCRGQGHEPSQPPAEMAPGYPTPRHFPLDGLDLPFHRYEHRRLTARDIMVYRIMTQYMNPTTVKPRTYNYPITYPNTFDPIKSADPALGMDLQVLRKMLFTSHSGDRPPPSTTPTASASASIPAATVRPSKTPRAPSTPLDPVASVEGPRAARCTLGDQVLDLVTRHYFEMDDTAMRTWISRARPPRMSAAQPAQPVQQTGRQGKARLTRRGQLEDYSRMLYRQARRERKIWAQGDSSHLRTFQHAVAVQDRLLLYDGGAFLAGLAQTRDEGSQGTSGARRGVDLDHWTVTRRFLDIIAMPTWPEREPNIRFALQPPWRHRKSLKAMLAQPQLQPLDLGLNPGRGRNHDGIWTTGGMAVKRKKKQDPDGTYRGRYARIGRRATSEPPPNSFTTANFPSPDPDVSETVLQIVFPRMTLAKLDARSRRRSLSRTRIEEMFDWDVSIGARVSPDIELTKSDPLETSSSEELVVVPVSPDSSAHESQPLREPPAASCPNHGGPRKKRKQKPKPAGQVRCENCLDARHATSACKSPCGHCGAPNPVAYGQTAPAFCGSRRHRSRSPSPRRPFWGEPAVAPFEDQVPHLAPKCPVARQNRCKCVPFPTWHTAAQCPTPCRRDCGNPLPRGSFKHRNAMTCRSRCCMCGIPGHSGRECRMRNCRCGGVHLGQDCSWLPTCRVKGCGRFWCGLHCRECGTKEKPFVGWRCWRCLGSAEPFPTTGRKKEEKLEAEEEQVDPVYETEIPTGLAGSSMARADGVSAEAGPASLFGDPRAGLGHRPC